MAKREERQNQHLSFNCGSNDFGANCKAMYKKKTTNYCPYAP